MRFTETISVTFQTHLMPSTHTATVPSNQRFSLLEGPYLLVSMATMLLCGYSSHRANCLYMCVPFFFGHFIVCFFHNNVCYNDRLAGRPARPHISVCVACCMQRILMRVTRNEVFRIAGHHSDDSPGRCRGGDQKEEEKHT